MVILINIIVIYELVSFIFKVNFIHYIITHIKNPYKSVEKPLTPTSFNSKIVILRVSVKLSEYIGLRALSTIFVMLQN